MSSPVTLLSSIVEHRESLGHGAESVRFDPAGEPHARALVDAVRSQYHRLTGRPRLSPQGLCELAGARVSISYTSTTMFGAPLIEAREGTVVAAPYVPPDPSGPPLTEDAGTRLLLRPASARSRAIVLEAHDVLDAERGYGHLDELHGLVALCVSHLPTLVSLSRQDLLALPGYSPDPDSDRGSSSDDDTDDDSGSEARALIRVAVMGTWHGPGGDSPAAIWLLHSYDPADDIAEGYLLVNTAHGYSEHGSMYGRDLLRFGGRIELPASAYTADGAITAPDGHPLTLDDAFTLADQPQGEWLDFFIR